MNELQIFNNPEFGEIRTITIDGEPWLVGKDVAAALGYSNPQEAIRNHVEDEDKGVREILTPGGKQKAPIINESGLYSLGMSSKLPTAKKFKRWISPEAAAISLGMRLLEAKMLPRDDIRSDGSSPAFSSHRINAKRFFKNFYKKDAAFCSRGAAAKWYILWTLKIRRAGIGAGDGIDRYLL